MTPEQILDKANAFYANSWSHLVTLVGIATFFLGLVIPILYGLLQRWVVRVEKADLQRELKDQIADFKRETTEAHKVSLDAIRSASEAGTVAAEKRIDDAIAEVRKEHATELKTLREKLQKAFAKSEGEIARLQGASFLLIGESSHDSKYTIAAESFLRSARAFATGEDERDLCVALAVVTEQCLPRINRALLGARAENIEKLIASLAEAIKPLDKNGRYVQPLERLRTEWNSAKGRT